MELDRDKFLWLYQEEEFSRLNDHQRGGLLDLLDFIEADDKITDYRWAAVMLATVKWETANTFLPIHERGSQAYFIKRYGSQTKVGKVLGNDTPEEGAIYAGEGFVQVTGENNAETLEKVLPKEYPEVIARWEAKHGKKFDLTVGDQPGDADDFKALMEPEIAYCAMSVGMRKGLFTGVGFPKYINSEKCDLLNSRRIINGTDQAEKIAGFAAQFITIFKGSMLA